MALTGTDKKKDTFYYIMVVHCPEEWVDFCKNEYMDFYDGTSMHTKKVTSSDNSSCTDAC